MKPCLIDISPSAHVHISRGLWLNEFWKDKHKGHVPAWGELILGHKSVLEVDCFRSYWGTKIVVYSEANLSLGSGYMNANSKILCGHSISIGNRVIIADNVVIRDIDEHSITGSKSNLSAPIVIEDDVWICMNSIILKGVTIGKGSVVAAGFVVTKDVPEYTLVGGVPAKTIRQNIKHS